MFDIKKALLFIFIISCTSVHAQKTIKNCCSGHIFFIENKNQWEEQVKFKTELTGTAIFYENDGITYAFEDTKASRELIHYKLLEEGYKKNHPKLDSIVNYHAYKMRFVDANPQVKITGNNPTFDYVNYYIGNDKSKWASEVKKYSEINYENLYKDIDLKVYEKDHLLKYNFIVKTNANPKNILLEYNGQDNISISSHGHLVIKTSVNEVTELKPYSYQIIDNDTVEIATKFNLKDNKVSFELPKNYNKNYNLIIDPTLIFSTFSGSTVDNWGYTATYDYDGFVYAAGIAMGIGYPMSLGAYQTLFGGAYCDVSITKYDTTGSFLIYSTLLGGNGPEIPHSIFVNNNNELFVFGTTGSTNFPTTTGAYDNSFNGGTAYTMTYVLQYTQGSDIFVSRFNANGTALLASTYIGGSGNDGLSSAAPLKFNYADEARGEVFLDKNNNCWIVSSTQSSNFPVSPNAFQPTFGGGQQDGVIIKMDNDLSTIIWSSFIGGSGNDAVYSMAVDDNDGNVYVAGGTSSTNFPTTTGTYEPTYLGGNCDGFITKINKNGNNILYSTYYGSNAYDQVYFVQRDKLGFVYVFGQTKATGNTLIHNALWNTPNGGQFISKLGAKLDTLIWSTVFGTGTGVPNISPTAFLVDLCNNIYLSGWGGAVNGFGGTSGLPITPNAFQSVTDNSDFYLLVITDDASSMVYATYFGGAISHDHVDGGTSRFDKKGIIYQAMCAGCGGHSDTPTTPGAWSQTNNSYNCNNAVFKMDFGLPIIVANFVSPPILCAPATVNFHNTSHITSGTGITCHWDFGNGSTSTQYNPSTTYNQSGIYNVTLIVSDMGSCNISDTITKQIIILSNTIGTLAPDTICKGDFTQIGILPLPDTSTTYNWIPGTNLSATDVPNPIASPINTTQYMLLISNGICIDTLHQTVYVDNLKANAGNDTTVCQGSVTLHGSANQPVISYLWSSNSNFTDTLNLFPYSNSINLNVTGSSTYYLQVKNHNCTSIDSIHVNVSLVNITTSQQQTICLGNSTTINAYNQNPLNPLTYSWQPTSSIISGGNTSSPLVNPQTNTTYTVTATDQYGCAKTADVEVNVTVLLSTPIVQNVSCYNFCNGTINVTPSGGTTPYTYIWTNGQSSPYIDSLCAGSYTLTITDFNSCKLINTYLIQQPPQLSVVIIDTVNVVCNGICNGSITVAGSGGTPPYTYNWISGQTTPQINSLCSGIYTVTVTDSNSCTSVLPVNIHDTSSFDAHVNFNNVTCHDSCNGNAIAFGIGGTTPYTFHWVNGETTNSLSNLCSGVYNVSVTEFAGCIRNVFITITQPLLLTANINNIINPTCFGYCDGNASVLINGGTMPYYVIWSNNSTTPTVNNLCNGSYYVTVTDSNSCIAKDTVVMVQPSPLLIQLTSTNVPCVQVCNGVAIANPSGSTPPYYYTWSDGQTTQSATNLCEGLYSVLLTDAHGCTITDTISVADSTIFPPNIHTYAQKDTIYKSQSTGLFTTQLNGFTYQWHPANTLNNPTIYNPIATPTQTTTYYVDIIDQWGCVLKDSVTIYVIDVICDESNIFIPNAFSPNGDNANDVLYVRGRIIDELYLTIYNRWGEMVFETRNISDGWNGIYKSKLSEPGVYVYYLDVTCIDKQKFFKKGNITLLR